MAQTFDLGEAVSAMALKGAACAIGVFDGVHLGHRLLIDGMVESSRQSGSPSAIVTFDIDPDELFGKGSLKKLQSNEERLGMLGGLQADAVVVIPFTREFASLPPERFLDEVLGALDVSSVFVGSDFAFGSKAAGDVAMLSSWGDANDVNVSVAGLLEVDGIPAKSTNIRRFLAEGHVREARKLLGRNYSFEGDVSKGRGEGMQMGFATANLNVPEDRLILADGVYGGYGTVDGKRYKAAISAGVPPTFASRSKDNLEVHLLGFAGDLYGRRLRVEFAEWLRPLIEFESVDELANTVQANIAWIEENL